MVSDTLYELCLPILKDSSIEDEDKTERLEQVVQKEAELTGQSLEDAVLDILWRFRDSTASSKTSPPVRHTVIRRSSPAPWHARTSSPLASPSLNGSASAVPPGLSSSRPGFIRAKSFSASPFTSPRPSPRLAFASPIPHSPSLNSYVFSESSTTKDDYGDYGSDTVDFLVNDDLNSRPSSSGAGSSYDTGLNGVSGPWIQPQQHEMSPYDMLRSVLGDGKTDEEIESALEANAYDLSATLMNLMESQAVYPQAQTYGLENDGQIIIGKSMLPSQLMLIDQAHRSRSSTVCKYWLANGSCLRADCRFSHDLSGHICKYVLLSHALCVTSLTGQILDHGQLSCRRIVHFLSRSYSSCQSIES